MSGQTWRLLALGSLAGAPLVAWSRVSRHDVIRIVEASNGGSTRLTLVADSGVRINSRLKPALELKDGRVIRFDSPDMTRVSIYFVGAPTADAVGSLGGAAGFLRASVCALGDSVCRTVRIEL